MDFDQAIATHTNWKVTLRWMINGRQPLDEEKLGRDDACEIGQWLKGEGQRRYGDFPAFRIALREHAHFHLICADVVRYVRQGKLESANAMLAADGEFTRASESTVSAIRSLKAQVEEAG